MMHTHRSVSVRRGNALVLVSAMLVLLTLIAAAYLTRTRSQRITASAMQETAAGNRRADTVGKQLSEEIAQHLFVKPIDPTGAAPYLGGDSAGNRLPPPPEAVRYGIESAPPRISISSSSPADTVSNLLDPALMGPFSASAGSLEPGNFNRLSPGSDGFPDGFNFAPYSVIPWTNWPDFRGNPVSPGATGTAWWAVGGYQGDIYGNPMGNPGFGDTRWLRSTEPVRAADLGSPTARKFVPTPGGAFFSHWAHLSWIPTPTNGWRVVTDISDIEKSLLQGGMRDSNDGFGTPYEQWLPNVPPTPIAVSAKKPTDPDTSWATQFENRRKAWFTRDGYQSAILGFPTQDQPNTLLPNFIKLDDPLGIGRTNDPDADPVPPSDEYITGTPRNVVARTFCDADGDGFTDSFWFLAPVSKERNVRTIVGVSVIDNASMLDLNVATRADRRTTVGFTPADLAVVSSQPELGFTSAPSLNFAWTDTRVGLFDNESNFRFGTVDPRDPAFGGNPAGFSTPQTTSIGFGMAFDPYRYSGRPTPQDPRTSPSHDDGSPSMLQSLGVQMTNPATNVKFWSPYFYGAPGQSLNMGPWISEQLQDGPQVDVFGPGGPSRRQQSEPVVQLSGSWQLALKYLWPTQPSDLNNGPFMRPEERTRWFQSAMIGEMRVFAPFVFGGAVVEAKEMYPSYGGARDVTGRPFRIKPFDAADEVELRAFSGNNDSTNMSRLERSLNSDDLVRDKQFEILDTILRSTVLRSEGGPGGAQLTNAQLVRDMRHKVTVVSGQRNELMPPWLWTGRPYLADGPNSRETYQNAMLWLGLHPDAPGARDENNDGRIDGQELQWGVFDLWRASATANGDIFPDGIFPSFSASNAAMDSRDWKRGVSLFEFMNRKFDLRRPLLVQNGTDDAGFFKYKYAYSVPDERLALVDFAREVRQRLRPALRTHYPQRNKLDWNNIDISAATGLPTVECFGPKSAGTFQGATPALYASYADRFLDQLRFGLESVVAQDPLPVIGTDASGMPDQGAYAWRSAWTTEAMTASLAANLATWRSRPTLIREIGSAVANALRPVWQPILPSPGFGSALSVANLSNLKFQAVRAVDPSKPASKLPNSSYTGSDTFANPTPDTADLFFPGNEKHPFLTECFFGWVYPATTTTDAGVVKVAQVELDACPSTPPTKNLHNKFVAVVDGKNEVTGQSDPERNTVNKIRTPVLVVQVANPWNEPIRLGDFRLQLFGVPYDFPDYELDASGNILRDKDNLPIPLMLNPGTETAPVTATVYLIASGLGAVGPETDLAAIAQKDPLFRRRWLDYFDLYEFDDQPQLPATTDPDSVPDVGPLATSPSAWPLFGLHTSGNKQLPPSKLLNAMRDLGDPSGKKFISLTDFRTKVGDPVTGPGNLRRGIVLERVLRNPGATSSANRFFPVASGPSGVLEVDRFDAVSDFDHPSTGAGTSYTDPASNRDTNLVSGGRFWSACARITIPAFDEPATDARFFPPSTSKRLVVTKDKPFKCCVDPGTPPCDPLTTTASAPAAFPGIMLGDAEGTESDDYFLTWTHVARAWSRLYDAKFATNASSSIGGEAPAWPWSRQLVDGSFIAGDGIGKNPDTGVSPSDGSGRIAANRLAPRFIFASRTEPDELVGPTMRSLPDAALESSMLLRERVELKNFAASTDPAAAQAGLATTRRALGDTFAISLEASTGDPDGWSPNLTDNAWLQVRAKVSSTTKYSRWLTSPVWAPLPDFIGLNPAFDAPDAPAVNFPELVLRKPTAFNCVTVIDPSFAGATGTRSVAYYGNPAKTNSPTNTNFVRPTWLPSTERSSSEPTPDGYSRIYLGDKGARLVDHAGRLLPLPLDATMTARPPTGVQWNLQGVWNTLDRLPQQESLQMLQKDDDFEQLGELLDVFVWGPAYRVVTPGNLETTKVTTGSPLKWVSQCRATFAEIMTGRVPGFPVGEGPMINRLQVDPPNIAFSLQQPSATTSSAWQFGGSPALRTPYAPAIPWGMRIFDAFTLDGSGAALRYDWSDGAAGASVFTSETTGSDSTDLTQDVAAARPVGSLIPPDAYRRGGTSASPVTRTTLAQWEADRSPGLSAAFTGRGVKGLLNVNTAPMEVLATLPHMTQMVYDDSGRSKDQSQSFSMNGRFPPIKGYAQGAPVPGPSPVGTDDTFDMSVAGRAAHVTNPATLLPGAIEIYRDRLNPSRFLQKQGEGGASAWQPSKFAPLAVLQGKTPTHPHYSDRGDPQPFGSSVPAASLPRDKSFFTSGAKRDPAVLIPLNRGMRSTRGFESVGEILGLSRTSLAAPAMLGSPGAGYPFWQYDKAWSIRLGGLDPYRSDYTDGDGFGQGWFAANRSASDEPLDARLSTDRQGLRTFNFVTDTYLDQGFSLSPDSSYGDSEEQNLLFKGISNLITTRSDVFTVYFRIRTVKQDPTTGGWNGTDPDSVLEDARYVMCVDRSNVNRPTDQPRIVYFSRVNE
jgi:hypothetical protein